MVEFGLIKLLSVVHQSLRESVGREFGRNGVIKRLFGTSNFTYGFVTQRFKFNPIVSYVCSFSSLISSFSFPDVSFYFRINPSGFNWSYTDVFIRDAFGSKRHYGRVNIIGIGVNIVILKRVPVDSIYFITKYIEITSVIIPYTSCK